jgi:hypothetical protein
MKGGGGSTFLAIVTSSLVIHLTSVSIISYAESNGGIFVLIGRIKPKIRRSKKSIVKNFPRKKEFGKREGLF